MLGVFRNSEDSMALDIIDPVLFGYSSVTLPSNAGLRVTLALFGQKKHRLWLAVERLGRPSPKTNINIAVSLSAAVNRDHFPPPPARARFQVLPWRVILFVQLCCTDWLVQIAGLRQRKWRTITACWWPDWYLFKCRLHVQAMQRHTCRDATGAREANVNRTHFNNKRGSSVQHLHEKTKQNNSALESWLHRYVRCLVWGFGAPVLTRYVQDCGGKS